MWRDAAFLLDMLLAARKTQEFARGVDWEAFESSELHQYAIMRALEILGEASRRVSPDTRQAHPAVPWAEIAGMRNRLAHEYFHIHLRRVWDTVEHDIPRLIATLEPLVEPPES